MLKCLCTMCVCRGLSWMASSKQQASWKYRCSYVYTYEYMCIYTHIYIYIYIHIHIYIYSVLCRSPPLPRPSCQIFVVDCGLSGRWFVWLQRPPGSCIHNAISLENESKYLFLGPEVACFARLVKNLSIYFFEWFCTRVLPRLWKDKNRYLYVKLKIDTWNRYVKIDTAKVS